VSQWFAISTERQAELDVVSGLRALGIPAYCPVERIKRRVRHEVQTFRRPLFPSYIFAACEDREIGLVLHFEGVHDFIRYTDEQGVRVPLRLAPDALAPVILAEMFGALDYTKSPPAYRPERGDRVHVKSGKWKGYFARVLSVGKRKAIIETAWCKLEVEAEHLEEAA